MLSVERLNVSYGRKPVLHDVDLSLSAGSAVGVFGHNGAGKSTLLKTIAGILAPDSGSIRFDDADVSSFPAYRRVDAGVVLVPEGRALFPDLSVAENLSIVTGLAPKSRAGADGPDVYALFPILAKRSSQVAGSLSGGEQRMLSLAMALSLRPRLLLLDEPSLGLAPRLVAEIMDTIAAINRTEQVAIVLVEQNVRMALPVVSEAFIMKAGQVILREDARRIDSAAELWQHF